MKKPLILLIVIFSLAALTACSGQEENEQNPATAETKVIVDALGREVTIPQEINSIVPLGNTPRMVAYLGLADKVSAISGFDADDVTPLTAYAYANKELWAELPSAGTDSFGNTDYYPEVIVSVKPDVIFCTYPADIVADIEAKTHLPVIAVSSGTLFGDDYQQSLRIIAEACGVAERAEEIINYIDDALADLAHRTAGISAAERPQVLSAAATFKGAHGIEGVRISDPLLQAVNADNVASGSFSGTAEAVEIDREQILLWDPDYIFCDAGGVALVQHDMHQNPQYYRQLTAYNDGHIYQYPSSTNYFANVELSLANCYFIGATLYPQRFSDIDLRDKVNEICAFFLGVTDYLTVLDNYGAGYGPVQIPQ